MSDEVEKQLKEINTNLKEIKNELHGIIEAMYDQ